MMHKLTPAHSKKFHQYVAKWAEKFKLADWHLLYEFLPGVDDRYADCETDLAYRRCKIELFHDWNIKPTDEALEQTACHEVLHILLAPLMAQAYERYTTEAQLDNLEHDVIRGILRVLFKS